MDPRIKRLIRKWQRRLGLADWSFTAHIVAPSELVDGTVANVAWNCDEQTADVYISQDLAAPDMEPTLLHEMLHVLEDGHREPQPYSVIRERRIAKLVRAFLRVKHQ